MHSLLLLGLVAVPIAAVSGRGAGVAHNIYHAIHACTQHSPCCFHSYIYSMIHITAVGHCSSYTPDELAPFRFGMEKPPSCNVQNAQNPVLFTGCSRVWEATRACHISPVSRTRHERNSRNIASGETLPFLAFLFATSERNKIETPNYTKSSGLRHVPVSTKQTRGARVPIIV